MQADGIAAKVDDEHGYVGILGKVAEIGEDAIPPVLRIDQIFLAEYADEA